MNKLVPIVLILVWVGCTSTPPAETPETAKETSTAQTTATPEPKVEDPPPTSATTKPQKEPTTLAESAATFKAKVELKCLEKYPEGKWKRKGCIALRMGAVRAACKLAGEGKAEKLCEEHKKYCTPEVREVVDEGLAFCDALAKDEGG